MIVLTGNVGLEGWEAGVVTVEGKGRRRRESPATAAAAAAAVDIVEEKTPETESYCLLQLVHGSKLLCTCSSEPPPPSITVQKAT